MSVSRRDALTLGLAASLVPLLGSSAVQAASPLPVGQRPLAPGAWTHHLFATTRIPGADWRDFSQPVPDMTHWPEDPDPTIDIRAEAHAALMQESITTIEQKWMAEAREKAMVGATYGVRAGYNIQHQPKGHRFSSLIRDLSTSHDNTVILTPTALTILQAETTFSDDASKGFVRRERDEDGFRARGIMHVGDFDGRRVLIDVYAKEDTFCLIGHVPQDPNERKAAIAHVPISGIEFGTVPGHDTTQRWSVIGIDASTLTFI